jgi:hypothetical protein
MSTSRRMRVIVDIERSATTVSGQITIGEVTPVEFFGWIELIDRLDRAAGAPASGIGPGAGDVWARAISEGETHVV